MHIHMHLFPAPLPPSSQGGGDCQAGGLVRDLGPCERAWFRDMAVSVALVRGSPDANCLCPQCLITPQLPTYMTGGSFECVAHANVDLLCVFVVFVWRLDTESYSH